MVLVPGGSHPSLTKTSICGVFDKKLQNLKVKVIGTEYCRIALCLYREGFLCGGKGPACGLRLLHRTLSSEIRNLPSGRGRSARWHHHRRCHNPPIPNPDTENTLGRGRSARWYHKRRYHNQPMAKSDTEFGNRITLYPREGGVRRGGTTIGGAITPHLMCVFATLGKANYQFSPIIPIRAGEGQDGIDSVDFLIWAGGCKKGLDRECLLAGMLIGGDT